MVLHRRRELNRWRLIRRKRPGLEPACPAQQWLAPSAGGQNRYRDFFGFEQQPDVKIKLKPDKKSGEINRRAVRWANGQKGQKFTQRQWTNLDLKLGLHIPNP